MPKKIKYRVVMQHIWGDTPRKLGLFDDEDKAQKDADETKDSMYHAWVEEEEIKEK